MPVPQLRTQCSARCLCRWRRSSRFAPSRTCSSARMAGASPLSSATTTRPCWRSKDGTYVHILAVAVRRGAMFRYVKSEASAGNSTVYVADCPLSTVFVVLTGSLWVEQACSHLSLQRLGVLDRAWCCSVPAHSRPTQRFTAPVVAWQRHDCFPLGPCRGWPEPNLHHGRARPATQ